MTTVSPPTPTLLLEARGITKRYGQVEALRGADFTVYSGEVVALLGDNGAGKSTLVKAITGTILPDQGEVLFEGRPVKMRSPMDARELGYFAQPRARHRNILGHDFTAPAVKPRMNWR